MKIVSTAFHISYSWWWGNEWCCVGGGELSDLSLGLWFLSY